MKNQSKRILACLMALTMLLSVAPVSVFAAGMQSTAAVSATATHKHKKVTSVKKATFSKDGLITVKCSDCKKVLSKKTVAKIKTVKLKKDEYNYTGKAIKPTVIVKDSKNKTLKNGKDYTVAYISNKNPGKAVVKVTFKGNYSGTKLLNFAIEPLFTAYVVSQYGKKTVDMYLSWDKVTGAFSYKVSLYKGKKLIKTVKTKETAAEFKSISENTKYRLVFTAYNLLGKKIISSDGDLKVPKSDRETISVLNLTKKEIVTSYNSAVNKLKNEKNVKIRKESEISLKCTECSTPMMQSPVNAVLQSFLVPADDTVKFKNGKGKNSAGETTTVNDFVSPVGRKAKLSEKNVVSASAITDFSGNTKLTIVLKKETATFDGKNTKDAPGNLSVADPLNIGALELPAGAKITKAKTVYPETTLQATINKSGKLTKLEIDLPLESSITGKLRTSLTIELTGSLTSTYTVTY